MCTTSQLVTVAVRSEGWQWLIVLDDNVVVVFGKPEDLVADPDVLHVDD
jgi:hypothetical protein